MDLIRLKTKELQSKIYLTQPQIFALFQLFQLIMTCYYALIYRARGPYEEIFVRQGVRTELTLEIFAMCLLAKILFRKVSFLVPRALSSGTCLFVPSRA